MRGSTKYKMFYNSFNPNMKAHVPRSFYSNRIFSHYISIQLLYRVFKYAPSKGTNEVSIKIVKLKFLKSLFSKFEVLLSKFTCKYFFIKDKKKKTFIIIFVIC